MALQILPESTNDAAAVHAVNLAAFPTVTEADLVDALRDELDDWTSFVAVKDERIVGHLLFTPVVLEPTPRKPPRILGLGPMAVHPDVQGHGIGSTLVDTGLSEIARAGADGVVVLGHPEWYPRFGFVPAAHYGLKLGLAAPPEAFLALELTSGVFPRDGAMVHYHALFNVD